MSKPTGLVYGPLVFIALLSAYQGLETYQTLSKLGTSSGEQVLGRISWGVCLIGLAVSLGMIGICRRLEYYGRIEKETSTPRFLSPGRLRTIPRRVPKNH
jgi:hypothetical protein